MKVKTRIVGNSKTVTIPKAFNVAKDTEFTVKQLKNGSIIYTPVHIHRNPFEGDWFNEDLRQIDVTDGEEILDSEWS
ncbi:type II toxin-antitoxin system PemI/MazE family antitoxin [Xylocopilactobacillus apicola]|uniref:AbrB family transcriptional regulator n=1 Tax=Xylocopilactobacillus apicola TaxID=2932184 RepID=A0AAU9DTX9_9LACO|nr:AbrB/MazE/SpoVT family DNA-binding domain-containing protein [Xylocopilactobacillus apicola]BDR59629.1 hypothetical protein XA3_20700 [Xylocopilactobacillus apicola]